MMMRHVVSFSGGKDSTALLLMMLERRMQVDDMVFCDTGVEFPQMYEHIEKVEKYTGRKVTVLHRKHSYEYLLEEVKKSDGTIGYGHPDMRRRWCTTALKSAPLRAYLKQYYAIIQYSGISASETIRTEKNADGHYRSYPLVEWGMTGADNLRYCRDKDFDWGGLYDDFSRVSCFVCPLQRVSELKILYTKHPDLWRRLKKLDKKSPRSFKSSHTLTQLEQRFQREGHMKGFFIKT